MTPASPDDVRIAIVGLGYVGLPLAVHMAREYPVVGFDVDEGRIAELRAGLDRTREVTAEELAGAEMLKFTGEAEALRGCNFYIVTVPTPLDPAKRPDLSALIAASRTVGGVIAAGDVVVFESTVFPGATEEVCVPQIAEVSGLRYNEDFFAGYSPERINPGDGAHRLPDIVKVTSGSTPEVADLVTAVYDRVITAGTHRTSFIRVAEAAKVIENIQRDVNIALVNELAMLFNELRLDTAEVLAAAGTKWNFHAYRPGLVGGHCIGVDPYYLTHKAETIGFHPQMILAGRRINDQMASFIAADIIKAMLKRKLGVENARVLVMGFTFKPDCPDTRNTKVADLINELASLVADVVVYDPLADAEQAEADYGIAIESDLPEGPFQAIVLAVNHAKISALERGRIETLLASGGLVYDIKRIRES
jgi:UDP-N-acetyl-D-galactosamine dehydrogenase